MRKFTISFVLLLLSICLLLSVSACSENIVTFKLNFVVDNQIVKTIDTTGNEKIAMPKDPQKDGYDFEGWFWDDGVWQKPFTANSLLDAPLSSDMSVYAKLSKQHEHTFSNYVYDNNATYDEDGTKTAFCDFGCGVTNTVIAEGTKLKTGISFRTMATEDNKAVITVPNEQTEFDFLSEIEKKGKSNITYTVSANLSGNDPVESKTVSLSVGENTFYILVKIDGELDSKYIATIYRRHIYTVYFNSNGGSKVDRQQIEEDDFAIEPSVTRTGYTFINWDYDFNEPIKGNITINAAWVANTDTPYTVEYYLQELDGSYTKQVDDTTVRYGVTDTVVGAEESDLNKYNYYDYTNLSYSVDQANLNADGSTILRFYYTRQRFTVIWQNYNGTVLETDYDVLYGSNPTYNGKTPTLTATAQYSFEFIGWSPYVDIVVSDITYVANYNNILRYYTITWKNFDGTVLKTDNLGYGATPIYYGETPIKSISGQVNVFYDWSPAIEPVTGNKTYTARFKTTVNLSADNYSKYLKISCVSTEYVNYIQISKMRQYISHALVTLKIELLDEYKNVYYNVNGGYFRFTSCDGEFVFYLDRYGYSTYCSNVYFTEYMNVTTNRAIYDEIIRRKNITDLRGTLTYVG